MKIDKDTKLTAILKEYPWLKDELPKIDERLKVIKSPMAKFMLGKMTVADASEKSGFSVEELLAKLDELVKNHKPKSSW